MLISMAVLAGVAALVLATCGGYYLGRRAGSTPPTWKQRTSRVALGRLTIDLLVALTARRIRRSPTAMLAASLLARARTY